MGLRSTWMLLAFPSVACSLVHPSPGLPTDTGRSDRVGASRGELRSLEADRVVAASTVAYACEPDADPIELRGRAFELRQASERDAFAASALDDEVRAWLEAMASRPAVSSRGERAVGRQPDREAPSIGLDSVDRGERLHALAAYEVVSIYREPSLASERRGYLRIGTRVFVHRVAGMEGVAGDRNKGRETCSGGWFELAGGGFACGGRGLVTDAKAPPFMNDPLPAPDRAAPLPYAYGFVRTTPTPMWWRIPTARERAAAASILRRTPPGDPGPRRASGSPAAPPARAGDDAAIASRRPVRRSSPAAVASELPSLDDGDRGSAASEVSVDPSSTDDGASAASRPRLRRPAVSSARSPAAEGTRPPLSPGQYRLERGYFVSLGERVNREGATWWRTARGSYVEAQAIMPFRGRDFEGVALGATLEAQLPMAFVMGEPATLFTTTDDEGISRLRKVQVLPERTPLFLAESEAVTFRGQSYVETIDGGLVKASGVRRVVASPRPDEVGPNDRWIHVQLASQILIAYEGDTPVYVTLVSTGRKGSAEEPYETPKGLFRLESKHISTTMAGDTVSDGTYSIQDVPWAMFFSGSYALHGAFWHGAFGYVRSHGCVNLGPTDARWLFDWTGPRLPESWHGVRATRDDPGTWVWISEGGELG